jgi:hypothetical protein
MKELKIRTIDMGVDFLRATQVNRRILTTLHFRAEAGTS